MTATQPDPGNSPANTQAHVQLAHYRAHRLLHYALGALPQGQERTRAWLLGRLAEENARIGDRPSAHRCLAEARDTHAASLSGAMGGSDEADRPYLWSLDDTRLATCAVRVYAALGEDQAFADAAHELVAVMGRASQAKKWATICGEIALGLAQLGDIRNAVTQARNALAVTRVTDSQFGYGRLEAVEGVLRAFPSTAARAWREEYLETISQREPRPGPPIAW
jgi:hypothetical protein